MIQPKMQLGYKLAGLLGKGKSKFIDTLRESEKNERILTTDLSEIVGRSYDVNIYCSDINYNAIPYIYFFKIDELKKSELFDSWCNALSYNIPGIIVAFKIKDDFYMFRSAAGYTGAGGLYTAAPFEEHGYIMEPLYNWFLTRTDKGYQFF